MAQKRSRHSEPNSRSMWQLEIVLDVVVFEQRVVHVHQKDYRVGEGRKAG
jgi:hypothetical protein